MQTVKQSSIRLMEENLQRECRQFVEQCVQGYRREAVAFCVQVIAQKGQVHGKTLNAICNRMQSTSSKLVCHPSRR